MTDSNAETSASSSQPDREERRQGVADRRIAKTDRRNPERVAQDLVPRRDPERQDRRSA